MPTFTKVSPYHPVYVQPHHWAGDLSPTKATASSPEEAIKKCGQDPATAHDSRLIRHRRLGWIYVVTIADLKVPA